MIGQLPRVSTRSRVASALTHHSPGVPAFSGQALPLALGSKDEGDPTRHQG